MVLFIQCLILLANFSKKCSLACTLGLAKIVVSPDTEKVHIDLLVKFFLASDFYCRIVKLSVVWLIENI